MLHTDEAFVDAVSAAVAEIEQTTDAELVVVAAGRSGSYGAFAALVGALVAWLALLFLLFSPFHFSGVWMPLELPLVGGVAAWAAHRSPGLLRLLVPKARQHAEVDRAAAAAFHEEAVHGTRNRTGVLIYVSALEDRVVVLPDGGIDARVPRGEWNALRWGDKGDPLAPGDLAHFLAGLRAAGVVLARHVPALGDNPNEIPDAPRVRP
jgi:putative membrane protein